MKFQNLAPHDDRPAMNTPDTWRWRCKHKHLQKRMWNCRRFGLRCQQPYDSSGEGEWLCQLGIESVCHCEDGYALRSFDRPSQIGNGMAPAPFYQLDTHIVFTRSAVKGMAKKCLHRRYTLSSGSVRKMDPKWLSQKMHPSQCVKATSEYGISTAYKPIQKLSESRDEKPKMDAPEEGRKCRNAKCIAQQGNIPLAVASKRRISLLSGFDVGSSIDSRLKTNPDSWVSFPPKSTFFLLRTFETLKGSKSPQSSAHGSFLASLSTPARILQFPRRPKSDLSSERKRPIWAQ